MIRAMKPRIRPAEPRPAMDRRGRVLAFGLLCGALASLSLSAPALAVGTLQASIVSCATPPDGGGLQGTLRVTISGVPAGSQVFLQVGTRLDLFKPPFIAIGAADANGTLTHEITGVTERSSPIGLAASINPDSKDPANVIGSLVSVPFVCPAVKPIDALQAAVGSGALTPAEALPVRLALQAAVALEAAGRKPGAVLSLRVARALLNGLVRIGSLTLAEAAPVIDAVNREITRLGGTP
jgi:hypothetical protein